MENRNKMVKNMNHKGRKNEKNHRGFFLKEFLLSLIVVSILLVFFVPVASSTHTTPSGASSTGFSTLSAPQNTILTPLLENNYTVSLTESGLPSGTFWFTTFDSSNGSILKNSYTSHSVTSFSVPDGNYSINVRACTMLSNEYRAYLGKYNLQVFEPVDYGEGQITVNGSSVNINVSFSKLYYINFTESGLPMGRNQTSIWGIKIANTTMKNNGMYLTAYATDTLNYSLPEINGTWYYTFCTLVSGYYAQPLNGSTQISGKNVSIAVTFSTKSNGYYALNFTETGLSFETSWSVNLNSSIQSSHSSVISFLIQNGSYPYIIESPAGYYASPSNGTVHVDGSSVNISISFFPSKSNIPPIWAFSGAYSNYSVSETNNSKTLNGYVYYKILSVNDTSQTIHILEARGNITGPVKNSYSNVSWTNAPFALNPSIFAQLNNASFSQNVTKEMTYTTSMGTFTVDELHFNSSGSAIKLYVDTLSGIYVGVQLQNTTVNLNMNLTSTNIPTTVKTQTTKYDVIFTESGLPSGTSWSITFNGTKESSTTSTISFTAPNGTYSYTVGSVSGYSAASASGSISVKGASMSTTVTFSKLYSVTFTESGLPSGTSWSITFNGTKESSTTSTISFTAPNGTYSYTVGSVSGYSAASASGSISVKGASMSTTVTFSKLYSVTFTESGLPSGTSWFVTLNGSKESSTSSTITFSEINGTYTYTVGQVSGYNLSTSSGNAKVIGTYLNIAITYTNTTNSKTSSFTISPLEEYGAIGGMIAAIGGTAGMIIKKRR